MYKALEKCLLFYVNNGIGSVFFPFFPFHLSSFPYKFCITMKKYLFIQFSNINPLNLKKENRILLHKILYTLKFHFPRRRKSKRKKTFRDIWIWIWWMILVVVEIVEIGNINGWQGGWNFPLIYIIIFRLQFLTVEWTTWNTSQGKRFNLQLTVSPWIKQISITFNNINHPDFPIP